MVNLFQFCCGEGEEEDKYGAFSSTSEMDWEEASARDIAEVKKRIKRREEKIRLLGKARGEGKQAKTVRPTLRRNVFASQIDVSEDFQPPVYPKSPEQLEFLKDCLKDNFIFEDLSTSEQDSFIDAMQRQEVTNGVVIIEQGSMGDFFYAVENGEITYLDMTKEVGQAGKGDSFGELALLYDSPRAVTCVAKGSCVLWKLDQRTFRHLVAQHEHHHRVGMKELVRKISILKNLDEGSIARFISSLTPVHWKAGQRIVQKGEEGNVFHIVQEGQVRVHDIGLGDSQYQEQILGPGEWFGERSLLTGELRAANVTAVTEVTTMAMDRETFEKSNGSLQALMEREMRKHFLKGLPVFSNSDIMEPELEQLVDLMKEVCYPKGAKLSESGKAYEQNLWIIRHGQVIVYATKSSKIYNLQSGDYFGDKSVKGGSGRVSSHTAVCEDNVTTWLLTRSSIELVIGDIQRLGQTGELAKSQMLRSVAMSDLKKTRMLGQGAFGKVWLVSHRERKEAFALKAISKQKLLDSKQEQSVLREKDLLLLLNHPFILHLVSSFQDEFYIYLLLPLIPGGELFSVLQKHKGKGRGLPNRSAAFYSACIVEALGHFHLRKIAYRDLKLENVLVDHLGYCKIIDLGFAKIVEDKTYTLVGTPEYLPPEIIMSKGHDKAVDYWSYGVLTYELLVGRSPFFRGGTSQVDMFKRIVLVQYDIPEFVNDEAKDLIRKLLVRRQSNRLGNLANGTVDVKSHAWFEVSDIDFRTLLKLELEAPWKPVLKNVLDSSNFDDYSASEREVERGRRLTPQEQAVFKGF